MIRIKELRKKEKITAKQLGETIGVAESTMSLYENGKREPDHDTLIKLADFFDVSVDYLLGRSDHTEKKTPGVRIPVYGDVAAGIPILAIENYDSDDPDDWEEITQDMARNGDHIALRIHGDSMEPKISNGDVVIVRLQPDVESGEIAIVRVNGDDATCKKIKKTPEGSCSSQPTPSMSLCFTVRKMSVTFPSPSSARWSSFERSFKRSQK